MIPCCKTPVVFQANSCLRTERAEKRRVSAAIRPTFDRMDRKRFPDFHKNGNRAAASGGSFTGAIDGHLCNVGVARSGGIAGSVPVARGSAGNRSLLRFQNRIGGSDVRKGAHRTVRGFELEKDQALHFWDLGYSRNSLAVCNRVPEKVAAHTLAAIKSSSENAYGLAAQQGGRLQFG